MGDPHIGDCDMLLTEMSPSWGKIVEKISGITKGFGLAILFLAISVNAVDIIGRVFLHRPLLGSVELLGFIAVLFFAVAFAYTAGNDGHITMDLLTSRFPDRIRPVIRSIMAQSEFPKCDSL